MGLPKIIAGPAAAALLLWSASAAAQGWGPPPPDAPIQPTQPSAGEESGEPTVAAEADPAAQPAPEVAPPVEPPPPVAPEPTPAPPPEPATPPETAPPQETADPEEGEAAEGGDAEPEPEGRGRRWARRFLSRLEFHGYARMPLNLHFRPNPERDATESDEDPGARVRVRSPILVDNDYYLSGFAYTRLAETDWSELFLTGYLTDDVSITIGMFASLYSDWAYTSVENQFGIAQASITWEGVGGVEPLMLKAGVFWDRLGYIEPYDTYVFGRTHQMGLQLGWDFANDAMIRVGFGAHLEVTGANQGFTPILYAYGGSPLGPAPVTLNLYLIGMWTSDVRPLSTMEEGHLIVFGGDIEVDFPWFDGPLYLALAGYWAENALFLANVFELLHSTGGRGLMENYFGPDSNNGTGRIISAGAHWPITIWRGLGVNLFGMLAHVWNEQEELTANPADNYSDRTYLKWGIEPGYQFADWVRLSLRYDRVILDMHHPGLAFRVLSPTLTFTAWRGIDVILAYSHYFYDEVVDGNFEDNYLRLPSTVPGVNEPDEDVFRIMARAEW